MYINNLLVRAADYKYSSSDIYSILSKHFNNPETSDFLAARIENSGIKHRSFCEPLEKIISLGGLSDRATIFNQKADELIKKIVSENSFTYSPNILISSCCSVPALPSRDLALLPLLDLDNQPFRVPVYQQGCLGGVWSLALSQKLNSDKILLCSYELCSLLFQNYNTTATQLMGAVLFADGIGLATVERNPQNPLLKIIASKDLLIKNSQKLLGYNILDQATELVLSPQIPDMIAKQLPDFINQILKENGLELSQIRQILSHPGGLKILDNVKQCLDIPASMLASSYETLSAYGNLSSASIFFVIKHYIEQKNYSSGDYLLILGIGPGINLELILCQVP